MAADGGRVAALTSDCPARRLNAPPTHSVLQTTSLSHQLAPGVQGVKQAHQGVAAGDLFGRDKQDLKPGRVGPRRIGHCPLLVV